MLLLCLFQILSVSLRNREVTGISCNVSFGMKDGRINDGQLVSKGNGGGTVAKDSRIEKGPGWCSKSDTLIKKPVYDPSTYLQVDLLHVYKITKLRVGGGSNAVDYVPGEFAKLSYKVNEESKYILYKETIQLSGIKYPITRDIDLVPPIITRYLRYQPQVDSNAKCMTMELYGCPLYQSSCRKGILNSSMRYSASATAKNLSPSYITPEVKNFPWGSGRKSSPFQDYLDVDMKSAYIITGVQAFQPKSLIKDLRMPDSFILKYRYNEHNWIAYTAGSLQTIKFNTSQIIGRIVTIAPTVLAKHIRISPEQGERRYLKMQFYGCLLSDPTIFEMKTAPPPPPSTSRPLPSTTLQAILTTKGVKSYKTLATRKSANIPSKTKTLKTATHKPPLTGFTTTRHFTTRKPPPVNAGSIKDGSNPTLVIVIVILVVIIILIIILFLVCLYRGRTRELAWRNVCCGRKSRRPKANGNQSRPEDSHLLENLSKNPIYEVSFKRGSEDTGHFYAENGNEKTGHLYDEACNKETSHLYDEARNEEAGHLYAEVPGTLGNDDIKPLASDRWQSSRKNPVAAEINDHSAHLGLDAHDSSYTKVTVEAKHRDEDPIYADAKSKENVELNPIYDVSPDEHDAHIYERAKGLTERAKIYEDPYQNVTGSSLYADPDVVKERTSFEIRKFPRERLRFLEKIGTGQFGEVHICEVDSLGSIIGSEAGHCSWIMSSTIKVAVKMLKSDVEKDIEREFMKEVRVMARLQHPNVVMLLGVCDEDPKCMVVEYMENGDLNQFLRGYSLTDGVSDVSAKILNEQTLLYMCLQISGGMKYLSSQGFVHRDLATRNCLVGHSFTVKISDFGMSRYLYSKHYYRIEGRAVLPIRWMAPESLFYGTFTSESDIWAFGVTLWEIFTFARETPYELMSDQQVIENACSIVAKEQQAFRCLPRPAACSDHIYRLLLSCWKKSPNERPNFNELTLFFKRLVDSVEASI